MEGLIVSTLGRGGFDNTKRAVYVLLLNQYVYIGVTGASNNTGTSSPHKRLSTHVTKNGSTKSAVWDNIFAGSLVSEADLATRMISIHLDSRLNVNAIEKLCIYSFQERCEQNVLHNKREKKSPSNLTAEEQEFAEEFVEMIVRERQAWIDSNFGENTEAAV